MDKLAELAVDMRALATRADDIALEVGLSQQVDAKQLKALDAYRKALNES